MAGAAAERVLLGAFDPHRGRVPRADADPIVRGLVRVYEEHPIDPEKVSGVANAVERKNAKLLKTLGVKGTAKVRGVKTSDVVAAPTLDVFCDRNLRLIKSLDAASVDDLRGVLAEADQGAWTIDRVRAAVKDRVGVSESKADFIARDQVLKLNGQITEHRQTAVGITHYTWSTSGDERVRQPKPGKEGADHVVLDGTLQAWSDPPVTNEKTGERNHPGQDFQCRCVAVPVL